MRNQKLWSVLCAAVLLCACAAGVLFTGALANDSGTPAATVVYKEGLYGSTIRECLKYAAGESWAATDVLEIQFSGTDASAVLTAADEGESTNLLFGQPTIFRADGTRLPIIIKGTASSQEENVISWAHGATSSATKSYAAANDYTFENLLFSLAGSANNRYAYLYAGSGKLTFNEVIFKTDSAKWGATSKGANSVKSTESYTTNLSADNFTVDAFYGWDAAKIAANKNSDGLIETSVNFGKNTRYFPASQTSNLAVVNYLHSNWSIDTSEGDTPAEKIALAKEKAATYQYAAGSLASSCAVKPIDTEAKIVVDTKYAIRNGSDELLASNSATGNGIGSIKGRVGTSPVAKAVVEVKSGIVGRISLDDHALTSTPRVGDNLLIVSGGSVGAGGNGVCIRLLKTPLYGDMICEISETTAEETNINWFQGTNESAFGGVYGLYQMTMTGGSLGSSGYVGLFGGMGTVNLFSGGSVSGTFTAARYVVPGNADVTDKIPAEFKNYVDSDVQVFNCISGGFEIGSAFHATRGLENGEAGTILTVVNDATVKGIYYGGEYTTKAKIDKAINVIKDGNFNVIAGGYGGTAKAIVNYVEGGEFGRNENGISAYFGNYSGGKVTEGIENYISGGTFSGYVLCGNRSSTAPNSNSRTDGDNPLPAIYNRISGGTFAGVWGAGGGKIEGDVVTDITGGEFFSYNKDESTYPYGFIGGVRNSGSHVTGDVITNISGGTFHTRVYGGSYWSETPEVKNAGKIELNISGGTFKGQIFANSHSGEAGDHYPEATVNFDLSENDITVLSTVGNAALIQRGVEPGDNITVNVIGGQGKLIMGADTNLPADTVTGSVSIHQTEGWFAHDYFRAPAGTTVAVTEEGGVFGRYIADDTVLVKGYGAQAQAATLLFDSKVGVKLLFDPADVALFGDSFAFKLKLDGSTLVKVDAAALTDETVSGTAYKAFVTDGIGLKDFGTELSLEGDSVSAQTFSIYSLAQTAQTVWSGEWLDLANAVVNLHQVYNLNQEAAFAPENSTYEPYSVSRGAQADKVESPVATLLMGDAVGVNVSFTLTASPANFQATIGGQTVPAELISIGTPDAETGKVAVSMNLFFNPKYMEESFDLVLSDDSGEYFSYTASVAAMASQLAADTQNENADNAAALLYYVQQAVDCANL